MDFFCSQAFGENWKYLLGFGIFFMFGGNIATAANPENAPTKGSIVAGYLKIRN